MPAQSDDPDLELGAPPEDELTIALEEGDPEKVAQLIAAGADIRHRDQDGYDAMLHAVHGRDVGRDDQLLRLLTLLLDAGADPNCVSAYQESPLRVLSRIGRFDAVKLLLDAGANEDQLGFEPLIEAVALGTLADVEARIQAGAPLEEVDWWSRTAWLVALLVGDIEKAKLLLDAGADPNVRGRCDMPPLFYAIHGHHPTVVSWLLQIGQPVDGTDEFGYTPLMQAVEHDDLDCARVLLAAGADVSRNTNGTVLSRAGTRAMATTLLDAGADPQHLAYEARRALLGYPPEPDAGLLTASAADFHRAHTRRFGVTNPERIDEPFWESMIRSGISAYAASELLDRENARRDRAPVWCAQRFGQTLTLLPDGRAVQIAGEHEDHYDPDFCIYNDVFVHGADGSITIYGYPEAIFPPTDFHTATLIGDHLYIIGSLGYHGTRRVGETPIHRLDVRTFRMDRLVASGEAPGWIYEHRATLISPIEIRVSGGKIMRAIDAVDSENTETFVLNVERLMWRRSNEPPCSAS